MALLNNSIMSDRSRIVGFYEDLKLDGDLSKKLEKKIGLSITLPYRCRSRWFDFEYKHENFSMFYQCGDVMLFAENTNCPERILKDLKGCFATRA